MQPLEANLTSRCGEREEVAAELIADRIGILLGRREASYQAEAARSPVAPRTTSGDMEDIAAW